MTTTRRAEGPTGGPVAHRIATAMRWATGLALGGRGRRGPRRSPSAPSPAGSPIQTVPTGSMEPTIAKGSAIVVDPIAVDDVAVGDVIVFAAPETGTHDRPPGDRDRADRERPGLHHQGRRQRRPRPVAPRGRRRPPPPGPHVRARCVGQVAPRPLRAATRLVARRRSAPLLVLGFGLGPRVAPTRRAATERPAPGTPHSTASATPRRIRTCAHPHLPTAPDHLPPQPIEPRRRRRIDPAAVDRAAAASSPTTRSTTPATPAARPDDTPTPPATPVGRLTLDRAGRPSCSPSSCSPGRGLVPDPHRRRRLHRHHRGAPRVSTPHRAPEDRASTCRGPAPPRSRSSWTNPNATDSAQVLVATTSGGTTTRRRHRRRRAPRAPPTPRRPVTTVALPLDPRRRRHLDLGAVARDGHRHLPRGRSSPTPEPAPRASPATAAPRPRRP